MQWEASSNTELTRVAGLCLYTYWLSQLFIFRLTDFVLFHESCSKSHFWHVMISKVLYELNEVILTSVRGSQFLRPGHKPWMKWRRISGIEFAKVLTTLRLWNYIQVLPWWHLGKGFFVACAGGKLETPSTSCGKSFRISISFYAFDCVQVKTRTLMSHLKRSTTSLTSSFWTKRRSPIVLEITWSCLRFSAGTMSAFAG